MGVSISSLNQAIEIQKKYETTTREPGLEADASGGRTFAKDLQTIGDNLIEAAAYSSLFQSAQPRTVVHINTGTQISVESSKKKEEKQEDKGFKQIYCAVATMAITSLTGGFLYHRKVADLQRDKDQLQTIQYNLGYSFTEVTESEEKVEFRQYLEGLQNYLQERHGYGMHLLRSTACIFTGSALSFVGILTAVPVLKVMGVATAVFSACWILFHLLGQYQYALPQVENYAHLKVLQFPSQEEVATYVREEGLSDIEPSAPNPEDAPNPEEKEEGAQFSNFSIGSRDGSYEDEGVSSCFSCNPLVDTSEESKTDDFRGGFSRQGSLALPATDSP